MKMEEQIAEIRKKILKNPKAKTTVADLTMVLHDALGLLDDAVGKIKGLEKNICELSKDVKGNKKSINEAKEEKEARFYNLEKSNCAANLVVKNVDVVAAGEKETKEESKLVAEEILKTIGVQESVKIRECHRFEKSKRYESDRPPILIIKLEEAKFKGEIFKNLHRLRDSPFAKISVNNEYPQALRPEMSRLVKIGNRIRDDSENKSTRFRVQIVRGKPMLKIKKAGDDNYDFLEQIPKKYL